MAYYWLRTGAGDFLRNATVRRQAKRDAAYDVPHDPELVVDEQLGPQPAPFDPHLDADDRILYEQATTTRPEELREALRGLSKDIAYRPSVITSTGLAALLLVADWQAAVFFFAMIGVDPTQRGFLAAGLTALNIVIAAVGTTLIKTNQQGAIPHDAH